MGMNDLNIGLIGKLDGTKSRNQINDDIRALKKVLNAVELKATLASGQKQNIENQLNQLQVQLSDVTVTPQALQSLVNQINTALQGIKIPNINVNPNNGGKTGIGDVISDEFKDAVKEVTSQEYEVGFTVDDHKFKDEVSKVIKNLQAQDATAISYRLTTKTEYDKDAGKYVENLKNATFQYTTATGEAISKTIQFNNQTKEWVESSATYSKALSTASANTDKFAEKQQNAVAAANRTLATIESGLRDVNAPKTLANEDFGTNGLDAALQAVRDNIVRLGAASRDTFTQTENDVKDSINALDNLITSLKNARYAATSLRTKDFDTVKQSEQNKFSFVFDNITSSSLADEIYDPNTNQTIRNRAEELQHILNNATDTSGLTQFLNGLDTLVSKFDEVRKKADQTNKSIGLGAKASSLSSDIKAFSAANPKVSLTKEYSVNGANVSLQSLIDELKNVDSDSAITKIRNLFKAIRSEAERTGEASKNFVTEFERDLKKANEALNTNKFIGQISNIKETFEKMDGSLIEESLKKDFDDIIDLSGKFNNSLSDDDKVFTYNRLEQLLPSVKNKLTEISLKQKKIDKDIEIKASIDNKSYEAEISKIIQGFRNISGSTEEAKTHVKDLQDAYVALQNATDRDTRIAAEENYQKVLARTKNELSIAQSEAKEYVDQFKVQKLSNDIEDWLKKNTAATKEAKEQMRLYLDQLRAGNVSQIDFKNIQQGFDDLDTKMRKAGKLGNSLTETFKQGAKSFLEWTTASGMVMEVWSSVRQGITELKELDSILTEISKTSDLTSKELKNLGENSFEAASEFGKDASSYLTGVQEMYRAGFDNADEMARLSILAQSAGDMESKSANDYLMATNAAYDYKGSVEKLNAVLDSQNYITNNAAVSMQDMADATSESASIAAQYGVEINELSALISVAVSKTRESGSEVGTALKALLINLQDTTSKPIRSAFDAVGISMTKMVNGAEQLKTPIELIKELSIAFNSLPEGDIKRANILNDIGGKHHANTLSAILSDMESYNEMLNLYAQGSGSAYKEAMKSANNWAGSIEKVKNSWYDLVNNFINSDAVVDALNIINSLIKAVDELGAVGTIGLGAGLFAGYKSIGICASAHDHFFLIQIALHT